jgi:hypothetical protein
MMESDRAAEKPSEMKEGEDKVPQVEASSLCG